MISANMSRYHWNKKEEADDKRKIEIWFLKKHGYLDVSRHGTITWTHGWSETKSSISIQSVIWDEEKHIRFIYTQTDLTTDEKKDFDYNIPLVTTRCFLGGVRYWFQCPWYRNGVYCGRRVGVLYKGGDYFACRHCYNLSYSSKNENRRYYLFPLGQRLTTERKAEELEEKIKTKFYKGRPTRKYMRLLKLNVRHNRIDLESVLLGMEERGIK